MSDYDNFEALDESIIKFRMTASEAADYLDIPEEWIDNAIKNKDFDDVIEFRGECLIHMDDIKDFVLRGGVKELKKRMGDNYNE